MRLITWEVTRLSHKGGEISWCITPDLEDKAILGSGQPQLNYPIHILY